MEELQFQVDLLNAVNKKLEREEKMYRLVCETSTSAILYYSFESDKVTSLANFSEFFDFQVRELKDLGKIYDVIEESNVLKLRELINLELCHKEHDSLVFYMPQKRLWLECEVSVIYSSIGNPTDKIIRFKDVSKLKSQNDELMYMAYYDVLTGLYNRNFFVQRLGEFVRKAEEETKIVSCLFLDIDDFRRINDGCGIIVGDEVVQQFGQFLNDFSSDEVIVSHFNSDIYCIGIYDPCGIRSVEHITGAIRDRLRTPFKMSTGQELLFSVTIGVAEYPEASNSALELINCAEIVMFKGKQGEVGRVHYFDSLVLNDFLRNVTIENKLKQAVFSQNFLMYFQPQYFAETKKLRGFEALIRWKDEENGMISPAVFIPIAEKNGSIIPIGKFVIDESIRLFTEWKKKFGIDDLTLSLNVSAIQYKKEDFVPDFLDIIHKYNVKPSEIELEITETILIDDFDNITNKLMVLRDYGVKISMDDFGTGYSSLSYLKGLPIDTLKIDKTFVDTILTDENSRIIMESIMYMVKRLGYETIAEGVETKEQFDYLKEIECDCIQGYYLGRPQSAELVEELLASLY